MEVNVNIFGEINEETAKPIIEQLNAILDYNRDQVLEYIKPELIEIVRIRINSGGGCAINGLAIYDLIKSIEAQGVIVVTEAQGVCASMAAILFLAGTYRIVNENAFIMIHELASIQGMEKLHEMETSLAWKKRLQEKFNKIVIENTKITQEMLDNYRKDDLWLDSKECEELGVSRVLTEEEWAEMLQNDTITVDREEFMKKLEE